MEEGDGGHEMQRSGQKGEDYLSAPLSENV